MRLKGRKNKSTGWKALHSLKQAPQAWYNRIYKHFLEHGFIISEREPTLYSKREHDDNFIMVYVYVDDIIYGNSSQGIVEKFKYQMMKEFEITDLGLLHYFLGLEVK